MNDLAEQLLRAVSLAVAPVKRELDQVRERIEAIPRPENGRDGKDAEPVTLVDVQLALEGMRSDILSIAAKAAAEHAEALLEAQGDALETEHEAMVAQWALDFERRAQDVLQRAIERIPTPRDGKDGINGTDGIDGVDGANGRDGVDGKDGAPGVDGRDGADGLGFDDLDVIHDGIGGVTLTFARGDVRKEWRIQLPCMIDRGVWKDGTTYRAGDVVTYGGSMWIAQKDDAGPKPGTSTDWRLSVKKGRDGKDGRDGADGARGPAGRDATIIDMVPEK